AFFEARGHLMPKVQRIKGRALEMQHAVVFGNQVQISSPACDAGKFGDHAVGVWNGMKHVAAHSEIEAAVGSFEFEDTLIFERQARRETCVASTRKFQMGIDDVDSEDVSERKKLGK